MLIIVKSIRYCFCINCKAFYLPFFIKWLKKKSHMNKNSRLLIKMEAMLFIVNRKEKRLIWKWKESQSLSENKGSMVWWEINIKLFIINRGSCLCHYRTVSTRWPCFNNRERNHNYLMQFPFLPQEEHIPTS